MALPYWDYFLSLEDDLQRCSRYVEFTSSNYNTYSIEFARIIMATAAEIDTVAKALCKIIGKASKANNICDYASEITLKYPHFSSVETIIHKYGISIKPWDNWATNKSPDWWQDYNGIKHDRTMNFKDAHLENAILSVSGLLVLLLYYYYERNSGQIEEISSFEKPKLLDIVPQSGTDGIWGGGIFWGYNIPI